MKKTCFVFVAIFVLTLGLSAPVVISKAEKQVNEEMPAQPARLQYSAGGHILGFAPHQVYLASLDHALTVSFAGGKMVQPQGSAGSRETKTADSLLGKVTYTEMWPGVDIVYAAAQNGIVESSYLLSSGADVNTIRLRYNVPVELLGDGSLNFSFENGYMTESAPIAWQEIDGRRVNVSVRFEKLGANEIGFVLGNHDRDYALTIDPVYSWHAFYGSEASDAGYDLAVDGSGNIYITGLSSAAWDGPGSAQPLHAYTGGGDILVVKLNSAGVFQWHTFYGATGLDGGYDIALDGSGNPLIVGDSAITWDGPQGQSPINTGDEHDIVALKLDSAGQYQWHTFFGSASSDYGNGVALGGNGDVFLIGTSSAGWNGTGDVTPTNNYAGGSDIVVIKLDASGTYLWHAFYGSSAADAGSGIAVDGNGNALIAGDSFADWAGPSGQLPIHAYSGSYDMTVIKVDPAGAYIWHNFFGSTSADYGAAIAADSSGNVVLLGRSSAGWNGSGNMAPRNAYVGGYDLTVVKMDPIGVYQWHTFYGSASGDYGHGLLIEESGNITIAGDSLATWNGPGGSGPLYPYSGGYDIAALRLDELGNYLWHIFLGSPLSDDGYGIAVDASGSLYIAGQGAANWSGPGMSAALNPHAGGYDATVIKIANQALTGLFLSATSLVENQPIGTLVGIISTVDPDVAETFTYSFCGGPDDTAFAISGNRLETVIAFSYKDKPSYEICLRSIDSGGQFIEKAFTLNVINPNVAPTNIIISNDNVDENLPAGTGVGLLGSVDGNTSDAFLYSFCGGADDAVFALDGSLLKTAIIFDYEAKSSYSICIRTSDNSAMTYEETLTIQVNNLVDTATFGDVPVNYWAWEAVESIYTAGITSGCIANPLIYCPDASVTRAQMAVFVLRGRHGNAFLPPAASGLVFADVGLEHWAAAWIEELASEGITAGCAQGMYCPEDNVTRAQMAIFLLKSKYGADYIPPVSDSDIFSDVDKDYWAAGWIKELAAQGITNGCGNGKYCPDDVVTRAQMAVFLQRLFSLPLP